MKLHQLKEKINTSASLDFGEIFGESIDLFKKVWVQGLVVVILSMVLLVPAYFLLYVPFISLGVVNPEAFEQGANPGFLMLLVLFVSVLFFVFYALMVTFALRAAFYRICRKEDLGLHESENYFYFFKGKYLLKILKLSMAVALICVVAMSLCFLPLFYVSVPISFVSVVFAFNPELSFSEIIKVSFSIGNKKWLLAFALTLVAGFLAEIVGMILCFIGIFATASFAMLPNYIIYKKTVGFEDPNPEVRIDENILFPQK